MLPTQPALDTSAPLISVVMANYQAGPRIMRALDSVLNQTIGNLEVIVSDDASGDDSVALVRKAMLGDQRITLIEADRNGGPARSRNRALEMARGQWIAIVDSDDIIHPERFERLLVAATHFGADVVADDLLHFHEDGSPVRFLLNKDQNQPFRVTTEDWILAGIRPDTAPLGYLKPMIKATALGPLRYDETLRIGEDYDLLLRILLSGASLQVVPEPWYLYRRHGGSISHRLSAGDVGSMIDNQQRLIDRDSSFPTSLQKAFDQRMGRLMRSQNYEVLVAAIKRGHVSAALAIIAGDPALVLRLWQSFTDPQRNRSAARTGGMRASASLYLGCNPSTASNGAKQVPPYSPPAATNWNLPSQRQIWADLANLGNGRDLKVFCDDSAGIYAAGFIPTDRLEIVLTSVAHPAGGAENERPALLGAIAK